jgi:hypothetical protein
LALLNKDRIRFFGVTVRGKVYTLVDVWERNKYSNKIEVDIIQHIIPDFYVIV